jgi:hypothetical protein
MDEEWSRQEDGEKEGGFHKRGQLLKRCSEVLLGMLSSSGSEGELYWKKSKATMRGRHMEILGATQDQTLAPCNGSRAVTTPAETQREATATDPA